MSKKTIFGEENFTPKDMVVLNIQDNLPRSLKETEDYIIDRIEDISEVYLPEIKVNHEKVRRWVMLCSRLENIEETELIDMATKKKIADLKDELEQQKAMWKKLKEFIKTYQEDVVWKNKQVDEFQEDLLDKIRELEGE